MSRDRLQIGVSEPQQKHLVALADAYAQGRVSLFLGAGVSVPYGIPNWEELVTGLLLSEASKQRFKYFYPNYQTALASWLSQNLGFSPVTLARVFKYNDAKGRTRPMREALQRRLYANFEDLGPSGTLLDEVVELIRADPGRFRRIVNLNFDDLLLGALRRAGVKAYPRYRLRQRRARGIEILHPHGFIPRPPRGVPSQELVFTEDEYNRLTLEPFHWAATELASTLNNSRGFFVGLSMSDPNLRRLLDAAKRGSRSKKRPHFLMRLDYRPQHIDMSAAIGEIQHRARRELARRVPDLTDPRWDKWIKKDDDEVESALRRALEQAHVYDRQLFKDLGVNTFWVNDFADMPKVLRWIRKRAETPA